MFFCIGSSWFSVVLPGMKPNISESVTQELSPEPSEERKSFYGTLSQDITSQGKKNLDFVLGETF